MRTIILLVFLVLLPAFVSAQPVITFDAETKDVGTVKAGDPVEHVFEVRNSGDKELVIERLVPS